ncbi:hypothetical protein ABFW07_10515 [Acinetobacter soli]|uniref:hypothetical protein n=1 Tax=Acinetobacter soli TaxID=487316 RepID=UPI0032187992
MSEQREKATDALRHEYEKFQIFEEKRTKVIHDLKSISSEIVDEDVKTLVDRNIVPTLENFKNLYTDEIIIYSIDDLLDDALNDKKEYVKTKDRNYLAKVIADLTVINNLLNTIRVASGGFEHIVKEYLGNAQANVAKELSGFRKSRAERDNAETESIYENAVDKYRKLEEDYRAYFYWGIGILLLVSICMFLIKQYLVPLFLNNIEFWIVKLSIIAVGITLISYFLKQSSHYQRLADQNYQTQVELQAYPSFMESIPTEEAASVRKELALKYFGREIDGTAHKDMSNLISDQMKSTTDMVKATTEAIKNLNGTAK